MESFRREATRIDEYKGFDKGHYSRKEIEVVFNGETTIKACRYYFYALKPGQSDVDASLLKANRR